jgi:hypothetical protein
MFTGLWTNRNPLRDAATTFLMEKYYSASRTDSLIDGLNMEITPKLTLRRRPGTSVYNSAIFPPINRFYEFRTFNNAGIALTATRAGRRSIRAGLTASTIVVADSASVVYNATGPSTQTVMMTKSAGAGSTYFQSVGNTLYMGNGVDLVQWIQPLSGAPGAGVQWGIVAPTVAPTVSQATRPTTYPAWAANTVLGALAQLIIADPSTSTLQRAGASGTTGTTQPNFSITPGATTPDAGVTWGNIGPQEWRTNYGYNADPNAYAVIGHVSTGPTTTTPILFMLTGATGAGLSGTVLPNWTAGLGSVTRDGDLSWTNVGTPHGWPGATTAIIAGRLLFPGAPASYAIVDPNGYIQIVGQGGKTGATLPTTWSTAQGALTTDNGVIWINGGPLTTAASAATQYGFAYKNSSTGEISNMSPASAVITLEEGNQITVQGAVSTTPGADTIIIYRLAQGGGIFLYLDEFKPTAGSHTWVYTDILPDTALNPLIQASVNGDLTPPPAGGIALAYHLQRIFMAVGNYIYFSTGPDAVAYTANGNSGFNPANVMSAGSQVVRMWPCAIGLLVFTVSDVYIVKGTGITTTDTTTGITSPPLWLDIFLEGLGLLSYDAFTVNGSTANFITAESYCVSFDPGAGYQEVGFPIADLIEAEFDPADCYLTYHKEGGSDAAIYLGDDTSMWYRLALTAAPESGFNWSPKAILTGGCSAIRSTEIQPGIRRLLIGPATSGPILMRDRSKSTDNGTAYGCYATLGSITLAPPGQVADIDFITLDEPKIGSRATLGVLLGEISGEFETILRTRQDPPLLPPSETLWSDRYSLSQSGSPTWCRHFQMMISYPAEDAFNEVYTYTIFAALWSENRSS